MQNADSRKQSASGGAKVRYQKLKITSSFLFLSLMFTIHCSLFTVSADENPLNKMRDETISFFKPTTGRITMVEGKKAIVSIGTKDSIKTGMRFNILREGTPFIHPVTKEPLGKIESSVGTLDIRDTSLDSSAGEIIAGEAKEGDTVRISETKVNMLFCQSKDIDWQVSDEYYRKLKETGRLNLIETDLETDDPLKVIDEAKRLHAEVALLLTAKKTEDTGSLIKQRLFWVSDGLQFAEMDTRIPIAFAKDLQSGKEVFSRREGEALLQINLPFNARFITMGDIDGDMKKEMVISMGKNIRVYTPGVDLQPALGGTEIKGSARDNHIWLDVIDLNKNGKDEIIITSMKEDDVVSYIYELSGTDFILLYKDNLFLRKLENGLIAQAYSSSEGFFGNVFSLVWEGAYKRGDTVKLPKGVNIYDFMYIDDPRGRLILAYDEKGFLSLYDDKDVRIWRNKTSTGGFLTRYSKSTSLTMIEGDEWAIKDRLLLRNGEALFVQRVPFVEMARGLGTKGSKIKNIWWDGLSMEEGVLIDNIKGAALDFVVTDDKIIVLVSPFFGFKPENIFKGESPTRTVLYMYPLKGK